MALNDAQFYLAKLAEECNEVAQRALKQMQFGKDESQAANPFNQREVTDEMKLTSAQRLGGEIIDLLATIEVLARIGEVPTITYGEYLKVLDEKIAKMDKYKKYSQSLGLVQP